MPIPIPIEITTSYGIKSFVLEKDKPITIISDNLPIVDGRGDYLMEVETL